MSERSVAELVRQAVAELGELLRSELRLAQAELAAKGKRASRGGALFGAAGAVAYLGLAALVAGGVAALSYSLPLWAAALVMGGALLLLAGLLAAVGKKQAGSASPVMPEQAVSGVKADVEEIRERAIHHDKHAGQAARAGGDSARAAG